MAQQTIEQPPATANPDHLPNRKPVEIPHREPRLEIHEDNTLQTPTPQPALTGRRKIAERAKRHPITFALVLLAVVAAVLGSWLYFSSYEETDDAQVDGHLNPISARINGTVVHVNPDVEDNHFVAVGTVLAEIDPADFQAELERARAEYERLQASASAAQQDISVTSSGSAGKLNLSQAAVLEAQDSISAEKAALEAAQARVAQADANYSRAEGDRQRYERLLGKREISQSEYDRIATEASTNREAVNAFRAELRAARLRVSQAESRLAERKADLLAAGSAPQQIKSAVARAEAASSEAARARAQLTTAELNLSYSKIIAPVSGIVGRKAIEVGQRVQPGQQLLTIVPVDDIWVTADFKETQLKKMRSGQPVTVHLDSYDRDYRGQVDAIGGASGSRFSLLPPENASGNYVKVVQRLPVRILLSPGQNSDHLLRPGMSVEARVSFR